MRLLFLMFLLLIAAVGCGNSATPTPVVIVVTATPGPILVTDTRVPPTQTPVPTVPPPTPTPIPVLSIQDTATLPGWLLSIGKVEARTHVYVPGSTGYTPNGRFWLIWLDAKNTGSVDSTLDSQVAFAMYSADNKAEGRTEIRDSALIGTITKAESRDALEANVPAGSVTHALLVFDLATNVLPEQLRISRKDQESEQSAFDLTTTAQAQATAVMLAASTETAVAAVQRTAEAKASETALAQRLADTYATSTAVAKAANVTATAEARSAKATATAVRKAYESYRTTAPKGDFTGSGRTVAINATLRYERCVSNWCADKNSKYIVVRVVVSSGSRAVSVNPLYFTLISTAGYVVDVDTATYGMSNYLDAVNLQPNTYTSGYIAFITNQSFIPGRLVWQDFEETVTVKIIDPEP